MKDDFAYIKRGIPVDQVGLVCWGKIEGFPWWPCKIEDYDTYVKSVTFDPDDPPLPPKTDTNFLVVFFDEDKLCGVCEPEFICEYTSNLHLVFPPKTIHNVDVRMEDMTKAYNEANQFILNHGVPSQKLLLQDFGDLDEFRKSRGKSKNRKRDTETGPPSKRKRSRFTRRNSKDTSINDDAHGDIAAQPEDTPAPGKSTDIDVSTELNNWKQRYADKNAIKDLKSDEIASFLAAFLVNHDNAIAEKYIMLKSALTSHFRDKFVYGSSFFVPNVEDRAVFVEIVEEVLKEVVEGHALRSLKVRLSQFISSLEM